MASSYRQTKRGLSSNNPRNPFSALYKALTRFMSGPIDTWRTQTPRQLKRWQLEKYRSRFRSAQGQFFKQSAYNPFEHLYLRSIAYQNRAERYIDFDQMEFCLHGDTKVAVPGGYKTLKELVKEFGTEKEFIVYSFDVEKNKLVPAVARNARKTKTDNAYRVVFENGQEIIGSAEHRLMLKDGTYSRIDELKKGDSLMPFYRKDLVNSKKDEGKGYRWIYSGQKGKGEGKGWIAEHKLVAEWFYNRELKTNEVVHHKNFLKWDNSPNNLLIMDKSEHNAFHARLLNKQRKQKGWWENFSKKHSKWMKENNPATRKDITFEKVLEISLRHNFSQDKVCKTLGTDRMVVKRRIEPKGFSTWEDFAKHYNKSWKAECYNNEGKNNPRFDLSLSYQDICNVYKKGMSSVELAEKLNTTYIKIKNRIKAEGFSSFTQWKETFENHKVAFVEFFGEIDLYDISVPFYENFATDSVISHNCPEIGSALDIYADEMTVSSPLTPMIHIHSPNQEIKDIIENLLYDTLNIEHNLFGWCRTTCKYGDFFLYLDIDEKFGITHAMGLPADEVERLEGEDPTNPNYVQFQWNSAGLTLENWQVAHFRILGNDKYAPYGTSVLDPVRRIFRQLDLVEQHMMAYRIVRSAERRVFYLDIAGISPEKVEEYLEGQITQYKRRQVTDDEEGRVDLRYKPEAVDMDFFIPVRGQNSATRVDTLKGGEFTGAIDDVKYLRDKLFTGLKIPQEYLTNYASDGGGETDKATLAQKDIRFARTIGRLQKSIVSELEKLCITHLFVIGYRGQDLTNFRLALNTPSKIAELQELEQWRTKFEVAGQATEGFFSRRWLGKNLFGMTDEEILQNQRELFYDRKMDALLEATIETTELEAGGGAGFDIGDDEEPGGEGEIDEEPEEEGPLLAAPGHRREGTTTAKSKGKIYHPVKTDKRSMGARRRSYLKQGGDSKAERGKRNVFPGKSSIDTLANGLFEEMENEFLSPSYEKEEENNLLEQNFEAKMLVESLERINKPKKNKVLVLENKEEDEEK